MEEGKEEINNYQSEELQCNNKLISVFSETRAKRKYLNYLRRERSKVSVLNSINHRKGRQAYEAFLNQGMRGKG